MLWSGDLAPFDAELRGSVGVKRYGAFFADLREKVMHNSLVSFLAALTSGEMLCLRCLTPFVDDIGEE